MPAEEFRDYKERAGWGEEETEEKQDMVVVVVKVRLFRAECLWLRRQWCCEGLAMLVNLVGREMATA